MNDAIIRSKLIMAQQSLIQSSENYDTGCMLLKEALDMMPDPYVRGSNKNLKSELLKKLKKEIEAKADVTRNTIKLSDVLEIIESMRQE